MNEFIAILKNVLSFLGLLMTKIEDCIKKIKRTDHCEEIHMKALVSKNNSTWENAVLQMQYRSWMAWVMGSWIDRYSETSIKRTPLGPFQVYA